MADDHIEEQTSGDNAETAENVELENNDDTLDPDVLKERNQALFNRAKKAEEQTKRLRELAGVKSLKELEEKLAPKPKEDKKAETPDVLSDVEELRLEVAGYSEEERALIKTYAKGKGQKPSEALSDDTLKATIEAMRATKKASNASPEPSTRVPVHGEKTFKELSREEKQQNYSKTIEALVDKARKKQRTIT